MLFATGTKLDALKQKLKNLHLSAHLTVPDDTVFDAEDFPEWSLYDFAFHEYMNIAGAGCQVVCNETRDNDNEGLITQPMAREMLCGMYKQKAIVLLHLPIFGQDVDEYTRALIRAKLDKIYICDLPNLEARDLENFLLEISHKTIIYGLTNYDLRTIRLKIREHLRELQKL